MSLQLFKPQWKFPCQIEAWLESCVKTKYTLNLPCGSSKVGDIRADIDPTVKPDIICDALHPPFRAQSFDLVISDPPWKYFNKIRWIHSLSDLTREELLLNCPIFLIRLKNFTMKLILVTRTNRANIGIWVSYKRKHQCNNLVNYC